MAITSGRFNASINIVEKSGIEVYCVGCAAVCSRIARSRFTSDVMYSDTDLYDEFSPLHNCMTFPYISGDTHPVSGFFDVRTDVMFAVTLFIVSLL